jgi:hypothetical protein
VDTPHLLLIQLRLASPALKQPQQQHKMGTEPHFRRHYNWRLQVMAAQATVGEAMQTPNCWLGHVMNCWLGHVMAMQVT